MKGIKLDLEPRTAVQVCQAGEAGATITVGAGISSAIYFGGPDLDYDSGVVGGFQSSLLGAVPQVIRLAPAELFYVLWDAGSGTTPFAVLVSDGEIL